MSKPRAHRAAAKAKRELFTSIQAGKPLIGQAFTFSDQPQMWAEWYASHKPADTAESYQSDAIADANSGTDEMNNRRVN